MTGPRPIVLGLLVLVPLVLADTAPAPAQGKGTTKITQTKDTIQVKTKTKEQEMAVDVSAPPHKGNDTFVLDPPGGAAGTVTVTLNGTETAAEKADAIEAALKAKKLPHTRNGTRFTFKPITSITGTDNTGEQLIYRVTGTPLGLLVPPDRGHLALVAPITGLDDAGAFSSFAMSLGFATLPSDDTVSEVIADGTFIVGSLPAPAVGEILTSLFEQLRADLPTLFQDALHLSVPAGLISFDFPVDAFGEFVFAGTTDLTAQMSVEIVPEPSGLAGLALAGLALALGARGVRAA